MTSIKSSSQDISPKREEQVLAKAILAGFVCAFVAGGLNPFDVAKIRLQNQIQHRNQYAGLAGSLRRIVKEEGFMGLAKGLEPSMIREITYSSIRIGSYEPVRRILSHDIDDPTNTTPMVKFFSALIVGAVGSAIANPLDLIKTRFQALLPGESLPYSSTLQAFRHISKFDGISGLYRGWAVTCTRASVLNSVQLGSYDSIKHNLLMKKFGFEEGFLLHLCASMVSGVLTTTAANPCKQSLFELVLILIMSCHAS